MKVFRGRLDKMQDLKNMIANNLVVNQTAALDLKNGGR